MAETMTEMRIEMFSPPHPGESIKEDVLPELGLTITQAAEHLGVSRVGLSRVLNGKAAISAEMAIRLSQWLGGSPEVWLREQVQYDLWHARKRSTAKVKPIKPQAV